MPELREVFEMTTKEKQAPVDSWREQQDRRSRRDKNRKRGALAVAAAIVLIAVVIGAWVMYEDTTGTPAKEPKVVNTPPSAVAPLVVPRGDFLVDPVSGATERLPKSIAGGYGYHVSPDGTMITYQGQPHDLRLEAAIFVANLDGSNAHVVSARGVDARWPNWSPDGSKIVYQGFVPSFKLGNIFVHDLTSGATTQITHLKQVESAPYGWMHPTFASNDRVLYHLPTLASPVERDLWAVAADGSSAPKLYQERGSFASVSKTGEIAFLTGVDEWTGTGISSTGGLQDASAAPLVERPGLHSPQWSPDGTKIAYISVDENDVRVLDVETGKTSIVPIEGLSDYDAVSWYTNEKLIIDRY